MITVTNLGTYGKKIVFQNDADITDVLDTIDSSLKANSWGSWNGTTISTTSPHYSFEDATYIKRAYASRTILFSAPSTYFGTGVKYIYFEYNKTNKLLTVRVPESVNSSTGALTNVAYPTTTISFASANTLYFFYHKNWCLFGVGASPNIFGLVSFKPLLDVNYSFPAYGHFYFNNYYPGPVYLPRNIFDVVSANGYTQIMSKYFNRIVNAEFIGSQIYNSSIDPYTKKKICCDFLIASATADLQWQNNGSSASASIYWGQSVGVKWGGYFTEAIGNIYYTKLDSEGANSDAATGLSKLFNTGNWLIPVEIVP
jgi:hypothetical protein